MQIHFYSYGDIHNYCSKNIAVSMIVEPCKRLQYPCYKENSSFEELIEITFNMLSEVLLF